MEKLILIFYVSIKNIDPCNVGEYLDLAANSFKNIDDNVLHYFIPVTSPDTRVECLNPKLCTIEEYQNASEILAKNQKAVDELFKNK